jgi:hypothetical protein
VNLVSLELIHSPIHVDLLANMPHLRTLTLIESFLAMVGTGKPVPLDLEKLTLTGSNFLCCRFLRAVSVPTSRIVLHTSYSAVRMRGVWEALERHRGDAAEPVVWGLVFKDRHRYEGEGEGEVFEVGLIFNQSIGRSAPSSHPPRYVVRLSGADLLLPWREDAIATLLTILSLDHVASLTLQCEGVRLAAAAPQAQVPQRRGAPRHCDVYEPVRGRPAHGRVRPVRRTCGALPSAS